ncbi:MAG: NAD(P)/FAD-dependent oxidoreductase [Desulfobacterales bacterium]|nr:MAG: NAD(P)/FAD-dependent oxidoreductase [Desulfobacterales bacterium]
MSNNTYDILVIGSGVGGMCAAALLSKAGYRTLVVEALPRIGGRCSTIEYRGFKLTTGVIGVELGGIVESFFKNIEAPFEVRSAGALHYRIGPNVVEVPSRGGMKYLLEAAGGGSVEVEKLMAAISKAMQWKEPSPNVSLRDWITQHTTNPAILKVFHTLVAATLLVNINEIEAREFFAFIKALRGVQHFGYSPAGSISLPAALADIVQQCDGEIWTHSRVKRIFLEDGLVRGALVQQHDKEISVFASAVISNASPVKTAELIGRENLDCDYLKELDSTAVPAKVICLQIAAEQPLFEQNHLLVTGARRINAIYQPTLICPEWASEGKHLIIVGASPASSSDPFDAQNEIGLCLADLKDLFPDVEKNTEILLAGTYRADWPGMHSWPGRDMPQKTPIINLYNVGDGVKSSGYTGLPAVVNSGIMVAEEIKQRLKLLTYSGISAGPRLDNLGLSQPSSDHG